MQNVHVVSRPRFHALSNGALYLVVSIILCITGKWVKLVTETVLEFNLHFQHIGLNLQESKCTIQKSVKLWSRNNMKILHIGTYFVFVHDFCLGRTWEWEYV
jgi:hypothetical protein